MIVLRLDVEHGSKQKTLLFEDLPIRIGRDPANECRLEFAFVSRVHARIERRADRLLLCDEGSRQGTWTCEGRERLAPRQFVDLEEVRYEVQIGGLRLFAMPATPLRTSQVPVIPLSTQARSLAWEVALTEADGVPSPCVVKPE